MAERQEQQLVSPQAYYETAVDFILKKSLWAQRIDPTLIDQQRATSIAKAKSYKDTYQPIRDLLVHLGDGHSIFRTIDDIQERAKRPTKATYKAPRGTMVADGIAYLYIPHQSFPKYRQEYADTMQEVIRDLDSTYHPKGWVVDPGDNIGGDFVAMAAGFGPLVGEGQVGGSITKAGERRAFTYHNGKAIFQDEDEDSLTATNPYKLQGENPYFAVLTSNKTTSSGEFTVLSFLGMNRAILIGQETAGVNTDNDHIYLPDRSILAVASAFSIDRRGNIHDGPIQPDLWVPPGHEVREGINWLKSVTRAGRKAA